MNSVSSPYCNLLVGNLRGELFTKFVEHMSFSSQNLWIAGYPFFRSNLTLVGTCSADERQQTKVLVFDADGGECYREEVMLGLGEQRVISGSDLLMAVKLESGLKHARVMISSLDSGGEDAGERRGAGAFGYTQLVTAEGARPYIPAVHLIRSHAGAYFPVLFGNRVTALLTLMNSALDAVLVSIWIDNWEGAEAVVLSVPGRGTRIVSLADEFPMAEASEVFMAPVRVKAKRPGAELEVAITEIITGQSGIRLAGVR